MDLRSFPCRSAAMELIEADADIAWRKDLLRKFGYKL
jgi:hypothetical protein